MLLYPLLRIVILVLAVGLLVAAVFYQRFIWMPGSGRPPADQPARAAQLELAQELRRHVSHLAGDIGERNTRRMAALKAAADHVVAELTAAGLKPRRLPYQVFNLTCENIEAELPGGSLAEEIVIVGAHYDSAPGTPGANDNATGVAALLALARRISGTPLDRTLRFVGFVNEEPPFFQQPTMGSLVYARSCRDRGERLVGMLSLETLGYYDERPGSQQYPPGFAWFYPDRGDFVGFVGDLASRPLVHQAIRAFRETGVLPSEGAALPRSIHAAGLSDHWSFWQCGYPALMVTDTAMFRDPHYHLPTDTAERLDYDRLARVVIGLEAVLRELGRAPR